MEQTKPMTLTDDADSAGTVPANGQSSVPDRQLSKFFKALSDQTRREILRLLEHHPHSVGEIVENFQLSQPTISRHLSVLREADLVVDQRRGQHVIYRLNGSTLTDAMLCFFGEFRQPRREIDRLGTQRASSVTPRRQRPQRPNL